MGGYMDWKRRGTSIDNVWGSPWVGWGSLTLVGTLGLWATWWMLEG